MSRVLLVGMAVFLQVALGGVLSSPWWMPDVVLIVLALVAMEAADPPWGALAAAAAGAVLASARDWLPVGAVYAAAGAVIWWLAHRWDLEAASHRLLVMALAEGGILACWLAVELAAGRVEGNRLGGWIALLGWVAVRVAMTTGAAWGVLRLRSRFAS
ncbi:MAG: hypothetical protein HYY15_03735 [Candidatus Omnitrophica bacterium]|nr:hypothetical protein [Candidatus Omnitrophota bacterium]